MGTLLIVDNQDDIEKAKEILTKENTKFSFQEGALVVEDTSSRKTEFLFNESMVKYTPLVAVYE